MSSAESTPEPGAGAGYSEAALRESEDRYRILINSIDEGFCIVEMLFDAQRQPVDFRFLEVNRAFEKQTGLTDVIGKTMRELAPGHEDYWFQIFGDVAVSGRPIRFERRAAALHHWYDVYAFRLGPPERHHVAILFKDITARKRAERNAAFLTELVIDFARLSGWEEIARTAGEKIGAHLGVASVSLAEVNETADEVTMLHEWHRNGVLPLGGKYRLSDLLPESYLRSLRAGRTVAIADVESDPAAARIAEIYRPFKVRAKIMAPYFSGKRWKLLLIVRRSEPYEWHADEIDLVRDLSARIWNRLERARAEEAQRESEERFRVLADGSPIIIWVTNAAAELEFLNRTCLEYFNLTMEQARSFDWRQVFHPDEFDAYVNAFLTAMRERRPLTARVRVRRADGRWRWIETRGHPRIDASGQLTGYIGSSLDITDLWESRQALEEADRRKDEFLATLAHELRNPLAPIRQAANIASSPNATEAQVRWAHDVIERQVQHMALLLDDLLDVSRITTGKLTLRKQEVDLAAVIDAAVESARPLIGARRHVLHVDLGPEPVRLEADPLRLAQVFSNLLTNAAKYTEPGGTIRLTARREGEEAVVRVSDTGIGIPPEALPRMFEMFSQVQPGVDRAGGGLGIGLALSKGLVELHGGTIAAASPGVGRGSTFTVRLPAAVAPRPQEEPRHARAEPPHRVHSRRVLVVDDNRDAAESLAMLIGLEGHEVRTAHDGYEALATGATFHPDCVLLDIGMPRIDGYEVARRMRREPWGRKATLIATTGWGQREDRERALASGFNAHVTKPADPAMLRELIESARAD